jgi:hypothetical protein
MATRGTKPKPVEQHKRAGTYRADRHGAALAVVEPLNPVASPFDSDPATTLAAVVADGVHWLARTDLPALTLLRELLEERTALREDAMAGSTEARRHLRDLDKQVMSLMGDLGFNPAARARLGLAEVKAQSKLDDLRQRQAARN